MNTRQIPKSGTILIKKDSPPPMSRLERLITGCIWAASIALALSAASTMSDKAVALFKVLAHILGVL